MKLINTIEEDVIALLKLVNLPHMSSRIPISIGYSNTYISVYVYQTCVSLDGEITYYSDMSDIEVEAFYKRLVIIMNLELKLVGIKFCIR